MMESETSGKKGKQKSKSRVKKSQSKQSVNNDTDSNVTCVQCSDVFTDDNDRLMVCERCENWFCTECLHMSDDVYQVMVDRRDIHWFCQECEKPAISAVKSDKEIEEKCAAYMSSVTDRLDVIEKRLDSKADMSTVVDLESRVNNLVGNQNSSYGSKAPIAGEQVSVSDTIAEQKERERRASNIMIYNIPESQSAEAEVRISEDVSVVDRIFGSLGIQEEITVEKCIRVGKKVSDKNRVTKVVLKDKGMKGKILRKARVLKGNEEFDKVFIGPDLTRMQRTEQQELRKELLDRREKGETDIFIRHGKIVQAKDRALRFKGGANSAGIE